MIDAVTYAGRFPGLGKFACCARSHTLRGPDGTSRAIPCDRDLIGEILQTTCKNRQKLHLGRVELQHFRIWHATMQAMTVGLPVHDAIVAAAPQTASAFLRAYKFEEGAPLSKHELTPVHLAALSGNVTSLRALLDTERYKSCARAVTTCTKIERSSFGLHSGMTPMHLAGQARTSQSELEELYALLLERGADPNAPTAIGATPSVLAIMAHNVHGVRALLKSVGAAVDIEARFTINGATVLSSAAYRSNTEILRVLLEAGADRTHINNAGAGKLHDVSLTQLL